MQHYPATLYKYGFLNNVTCMYPAVYAYLSMCTLTMYAYMSMCTLTVYGHMSMCTLTMYACMRCVL